MTKIRTWEQRGKSAEQRFEEKVKKGDGCWLWQSAFHTNGYGMFWVGGLKRNEYAHRFAWVMANGSQIPPGMVVMHSCDNPACVNPAHLSIGSNKDNTLDAVSKRRMAFGVRNGGGVKLNDAKAAAIKALKGIRGCVTVGREFGISKRNVLRIWHGRLWKHV